MEATDEPEADALDAYSHAVIAAVDRVGPAVVSLSLGRGRREGGMGSGVLVAPDGYVLTNAHVVDGSSSIEATFTDGRRFDARVVGLDRPTDLALVRVSGSSLPFAKMGTASALRQGQLVVAIGNPLGFQSTVSTGVVSATERGLRGRDGRMIENLVQHTAPLNPGNSGGPLVDFRGRLVGVNTAIIAFAQGMSFAIPSETVDWVVPKLLSDGRVRRVYLGIQGQSRPIEARRLARHALEGRGGVEVVSVESGTPAHGAGLRSGDVIVTVQNARIERIDALLRALASSPVGARLELGVLRGLELVKVAVTPREAAA